MCQFKQFEPLALINVSMMTQYFDVSIIFYILSFDSSSSGSKPFLMFPVFQGPFLHSKIYLTKTKMRNSVVIREILEREEKSFSEIESRPECIHIDDSRLFLEHFLSHSFALSDFCCL